LVTFRSVHPFRSPVPFRSVRFGIPKDDAQSLFAVDHHLAIVIVVVIVIVMAFFAAAIAPAAPKDRPVRQQFVRAGIASGSRQHIQAPGRQQQVHVTVILVVVVVVIVIGIEFHSVLKQ